MRIKKELSILHTEVETLRAASAKANHTSAHPSAIAVSNMSKEEMLQELGRVRGATAQLEIELAGTKKKAEIFESRVADLEVLFSACIFIIPELVQCLTSCLVVTEGIRRSETESAKLGRKERNVSGSSGEECAESARDLG